MTEKVGFDDFERQAMKDRAEELRRQAKNGKSGEADVMDLISKMPPSEQKIAMGIHNIAKELAPDLEIKTWYGFPAYAQDKKVLLFFKAASRFDERYNELGFQSNANLDDGEMWPTAYAITEWNDKVENEVRRLVKEAMI